TDCAKDALCIGPLPNEAGSLCLSRCAGPDSQSTCRPGYYCYALSSGTGGVCWIADAFAADAGPAQQKVGDPCLRDNDCEPATPTGQAVCIPETLSDGGASGFPGGYCSAACSTDPSVCSADGGALCVLLS